MYIQQKDKNNKKRTSVRYRIPVQGITHQNFDSNMTVRYLGSFGSAGGSKYQKRCRTKMFSRP